ncbi:DUF3515 domain-containing protein [Corynebacterium alimapuense]|uniref:DUF3515 domain-containing protein n=1 Tax=Corynebacterium alimapuense TaxID=1576874 RepID=A0A3M8K556_9CORY|nr:DUF3515 domain-containing protein [Corynebacterium alimapuense]RNE48326.1 DUF3515 domain-containing protein [Corynebacterium alimapuense]
MSAADSNQLSRYPKTAAYLFLVLAVALVVGVLIGAKVVYDRVSTQPVAMTTLPAPLADSAECTEFIAGLPDELIGHDRAEIAEPVPDGVAAWSSSSLERVTLRCGVDLPTQYDDYAQPVEIEGVEWLLVSDVTPGSTLASWYSVGRSPIVAVTADELALDGEDNPVAELSEAMMSLAETEQTPNPAPLSQLAAGDSSVCGDLMDNLPDALADDYQRIEVTESDTAAWTSQGKEPIVLRCGVAAPVNYQPGIQLNQVDDITWFEDTTLANGTTASTWFALGRATDIAVSLPQDTGNTAIVELGSLIAEYTPEQ